MRNRRAPIARRSASWLRGRDALALLAQAHRQVASLFAQARQDRLALRELRHAVQVHGRIEGELLYPVLEQVLGDEVAGLVEEARRRHAWLKVRLIELSVMDGDEAVQSRLRQLEEQVRKDTVQEESQLFPRARRALSRRRLRELGARMQSREDELNGGLYPG